MTDPLFHFYSKFGYDKNSIHQVSSGDKYLGIMLKNGQIGVCSTLNTDMEPDLLTLDAVDLNTQIHRIYYNAYVNAILNYNVKLEDKKDIFHHIDFSIKNKIVMIGNFRSLVKKFMDESIQLHVFDRIEDDVYLTPYHQMGVYLSNANTLILTSTTIFNGSFEEIVNQTSKRCEIFLLGPSSILHPDMKSYRNIKNIYGAIFNLFDDRILNMIAEGNGAQTFLKYGKKVNI